MVYSYYCSMIFRGLSIPISFLLITSFISLLNFSTKFCLSYSFPLTALLSSYTNSSIILFLCSTLFNSVIFVDLLSLLPNSFFSFTKNSFTIGNPKSPLSKFSKIFSFQISTNSPYTYISIYWIYSFTNIFLIFILIYSLYAVTKLAILLTSLSNISSFATSIFNPVLSLELLPLLLVILLMLPPVPITLLFALATVSFKATAG